MPPPNPLPIWQIEIRVTDLDRAMAFYAGVLGWRIHKVSDDYAMIDTGRAPITSLWAIAGTGMPLGVCHYVQSADCVVDAGRAVLLGGQVVVEYTEIEGSGAFTDTLDPWRNEIAFWQAATPGSPEFDGAPLPHFAWIELGAADSAAARDYYRELLGWQFEANPAVEDYAVCTEVAPGIGLVGGERGSRLRGLTDYLSVADLDSTLAAISRFGGEALGEAVELPDGGRMALFVDPDGNRFGLVQR